MVVTQKEKTSIKYKKMNPPLSESKKSTKWRNPPLRSSVMKRNEGASLLDGGFSSPVSEVKTWS
jgi:hypothetical protein